MPTHTSPRIRLGSTMRGGIAPSIYALVERGVLKRPEQAAAVRGRVQLRFRDAFPPVAMVFAEDGIEVFDGDAGRANLTLTAGLADLVLLTTAPLRMGMPSPASARGRAVLQRMATGQIKLSGDLGLARAMLAVMAIDVPDARFAKPPQAAPAAEPEGWIDVLT